MDATTYEWSPAERFVSGAAPSATSPSVDVQSAPRFMPFGIRQSPGSRLQGEQCLPTALDYVGSPCRFFSFPEATPYSAVRRWTMEFDAERAASSVQSSDKPATADAERICAMQEQLRQLQYDNRLLKQASALFAREICNSTPVGVER